VDVLESGAAKKMEEAREKQNGQGASIAILSQPCSCFCNLYDSLR
jgi:hypothetical protein